VRQKIKFRHDNMHGLLMKRRSFINTSLAASATMAVPGFVTQLSAQAPPADTSSPAAPAADTLAFRNFQARGGFLVSARKNAGGVYHVEIQARRDHPCQAGQSSSTRFKEPSRCHFNWTKATASAWRLPRGLDIRMVSNNPVSNHTISPPTNY
jgi:hypothetical protein